MVQKSVIFEEKKLRFEMGFKKTYTTCATWPQRDFFKKSKFRVFSKKEGKEGKKCKI